MTTLNRISPAELKTLLSRGSVELIDVRTAAEFDEVHVKGARNLPLDHLNPTALLWPNTDAGRPIYLICRSGGRGQKGCEKLTAAGFTNVINVEGGTQACEQAGVPVVRAAVMPIPRQVQIVAGGLALLGGVLAVAVHPWFAGLPVAVGLGLLLTGLTGSCLLGMAMAKMPWNRRATRSG
jgi:rhodanese-related sulfurtransferase